MNTQKTTTLGNWGPIIKIYPDDTVLVCYRATGSTRAFDTVPEAIGATRGRVRAWLRRRCIERRATPCTCCGGTGVAAYDDGPDRCHVCQGRGNVPRYQPEPDTRTQRLRACAGCGGGTTWRQDDGTPCCTFCGDYDDVPF